MNAKEFMHNAWWIYHDHFLLGGADSVADRGLLLYALAWLTMPLTWPLHLFVYALLAMALSSQGTGANGGE